MTCPSTAWDGRRKVMTACVLPSGHAGPHEDAETIWLVDVAPPRAMTLRGRVFLAIESKPWTTTRELSDLLGADIQQVSGALAKLHTQGKVERRRMLGGDAHGVAFAYRVRASSTRGWPTAGSDPLRPEAPGAMVLPAPRSTGEAA